MIYQKDNLYFSKFLELEMCPSRKIFVHRDESLHVQNLQKY